MRAMQAVLAVVFTITATAQEVRKMPEIVLPEQPTQVEAPPPQDEPQRELPVFTDRQVEPNTVTDGTAGDVILNGSGTPWPLTVAGVLLRASPGGYPDVIAKLGMSNGVFRILDPNNVSRLHVQANGNIGMGETSPAHLLHLTRNQDASTTILVNNANAGTAGAASLRSLRFSQGATTMAQVSSVGSGSTGYSGGPNALLLWNHMSAPTVIGTSDTERMRVLANGNVTIGSTADYGRLGVFDNRDGGLAFQSVHQTVIEANATQFDHAAGLTTVQTVNTGVENYGGAVGLWIAALRNGAGHSWRTIGMQVSTGIQSGQSGTMSQALGLLVGITKGNGTVDQGYGLWVDDIPATTGYGVYQGGADDRNYFAGRVGIGTVAPAHALDVVGSGRITGDFTVEGNIAAKFQDLAEWVPATEDLEPGTVVVLDPNVANQVMPSSRPYDTTVAGVVSVQPGIILGEKGAMKEQIATTGRVKVRVDATAGPIRIGDLLVSSHKPGTAMKSEAVDLGGIAMHRPGTLIGKALEPLDGGVGEILVLLSLQ